MASKSRTRWYLLGLLAAALAAALGFLFAPRPVAVDVATVGRGPMAETVQDLGQARVRDAYMVSAPVGGRVMRPPLKVGDWVSAGMVVARIAPASPSLADPSTRAQRTAALAQARAEVDRADAERLRASQTLARLERLYGQGFAPRQTVDDARAAARQAVSAASAARAAADSARAALMEPRAAGERVVTVRSPATGYVTRVPEPSERTVAMGAPLIEISDDTGLEAAVEFLSQDAVRIREGMEAEIYDWGGPGTLPARVRRVEPQGFTKISALGVEEQRSIVLLQFTGPPAPRRALAPGFRIWGRVFLRRDPNALKVPLGALTRSNGGWAVYRLEERKARLRPVRVGATDDRDAEVLGGLGAGERVIIFPSDAVKDGASVKPR